MRPVPPLGEEVSFDSRLGKKDASVWIERVLKSTEEIFKSNKISKTLNEVCNMVISNKT